MLEVARISHFFSKDKLTFAVSAGREHAIDYTLADLEGRLDPRRFVRIHRATIANLAFVAELYPGVDGMLIRLKDDRKTELSVARDRVRDLKRSARESSPAALPFQPVWSPVQPALQARSLQRKWLKPFCRLSFSANRGAHGARGAQSAQGAEQAHLVHV